LDGFQAIAPWLRQDLRERLYAMSNYGIWFLFLALWFIQPLNAAFWDLADLITSWLGVDPYLGYVGWRKFRFWDQSAF
jgi:hypothetical protein